jgi:hypothetical protein
MFAVSAPLEGLGLLYLGDSGDITPPFREEGVGGNGRSIRARWTFVPADIRKRIERLTARQPYYSYGLPRSPLEG